MKSLLGKLGIVLIGLVIFGYRYPVVNVANAQSAWIEWEQSLSFGPKPLPLSPEIEKLLKDIEWRRGKAFPTYSKCMEYVRERVMAIRLSEMPDDPFPEFKISSYGEDYISFKNKKDGSFGKINFYCYPDTVDPRK